MENYLKSDPLLMGSIMFASILKAYDCDTCSSNEIWLIDTINECFNNKIKINKKKTANGNMTHITLEFFMLKYESENPEASQMIIISALEKWFELSSNFYGEVEDTYDGEINVWIGDK